MVNVNITVNKTVNNTEDYVLSLHNTYYAFIILCSK